jgi:hypothetical protein
MYTWNSCSDGVILFHSTLGRAITVFLIYATIKRYNIYIYIYMCVCVCEPRFYGVGIQGTHSQVLQVVHGVRGV